MAQEVFPMKVERGDESKDVVEFESPKDFTAFSSKSKQTLELLDSELVFIGYGVKVSSVFCCYLELHRYRYLTVVCYRLHSGNGTIMRTWT